MTWVFRRTNQMELIIGRLQDLIEETADYFDEELTAQLNITKAWLEDAKTTIHSHEFQRLSIANEIGSPARGPVWTNKIEQL